MRNKNQLISGVFLDLVREKIGECTAFFIKKDTVRIIPYAHSLSA